MPRKTTLRSIGPDWTASLTEIGRRLHAARSIAYMITGALDGGETDLEVLGAASLRHAHGILEEVEDELFALRDEVRTAREAQARSTIAELSRDQSDTEASHG